MAPLHLPQEIVTEIIRRLPLRSLLRCKLLSKQLKNLIRDPKFYTLHKDISRTTFFHGRDGLYCVSICDGDADDNKARIHGRNIPPFTVHRLLSGLDTPRLIGFSHGIACLKEVNGRFLLHNWFTGSSKTVANSPRQERSRCLVHYGFGHDYYGDNYKIFVGCKCCRCWIYSYRNKEWDSFKGFPYKVFSCSGEVAHSFNGVLHWALTAGDNQKHAIVTYDLHTNKFGEIQVPPPFASASLQDGSSYPIRPSMSEVDGQLCYVCKLSDNGYKLKTAVWVMKEYGVGDSWERFTIQCDLKLTNGMEPTTLLYKLGDGGCGRLVLFVYKYGQPLIWCNIDNNKVYIVSEKTWQKKLEDEEQQKRGN